jgi:transposase
VSNLQLITTHTEHSLQLDYLLRLQSTCASQATDLQYQEKLIRNYQCKIQEYKQQNIEYKSKANYWEAQFAQLKTKEEELKNEIAELKAQLNKREQQLFGRKSEKNKKTTEQKPNASTKKRGQQITNKIPNRRSYNNLPEIIEDVSLSPEDIVCHNCKLSYEVMPTTDDSEIIDIINVKAYKRIIRRKRYKRCCCKSNQDPQFITAPVADKLLPKCKLGKSIWARILLRKFEYQEPLNRTLKELANCGLELPIGTITGGLRKLIPFFMPIYDAMVARSLAAEHWHADETRWKVFEHIEDKHTNNWFLWVFQNAETCVYKMSPRRSSKLLIDHFGNNHKGGILNVDRYAAYKVIAKVGLFILAFCWAHVRRDFLSYAKGYPEQEAWALSWVEIIARLYHINNQRISCKQESANFKKHDKELRIEIDNMYKKIETQLVDEKLLPSAKKLLKSLSKHWDGLTIFVDYPNIPMDNNPAERAIRAPVLGRNSYYGSSSIWAFELAVIMFTICATIKLWKLNIHTWLMSYLDMCAVHGGKPPPDIIENYLPWNMNETQKKLFSEILKHEISG